MLCACLLALALGADDSPVTFTPRQERRILQHSPVPPVPDDPTNAWEHDPRAARLGQALFFDAGFSSNNQVSCATCHGPMLGFTDARALPMGLAPGTRNAPGLLNVAHQRWFFWDGRADTLWSQALHPIEDPAEFGSSHVEYVRRVHDDPAYREAYEHLFGPLPGMDDLERFPRDARVGTPGWDSMTTADRESVHMAIANLAKSIAAYETRLRSVRSPFDVFVEGLREDDLQKQEALSPSARRGLQLFVDEAGCRQCHSGPLFSDFEFHNIGVPPGHDGPPRDPGRHAGIAVVQSSRFSAHGPYSDDPKGDRARRTASTERGQEHWGSFKTPSLRNVSRTAPYMHQGQLETIEDVLAYYDTLDDMMVQDHHQETVLKPLNLDASQLQDLATFLRSLESPLPDRSLFGPISPVPPAEPVQAPGNGLEP